MNSSLKLFLTEDGSHTIAVPSMDEHFHSIHGALSESKHIFINAGLKLFSTDRNISILEVGFGTGLNALLTLLESWEGEKKYEYTSIEKDPLPEELYTPLNYPQLLEIPDETFLQLHQCKWNEVTYLNEHFTLHKLHTSVQEVNLQTDYFDLVYFDAFGPDKQPGMWTDEVFLKISRAMKHGGILVTYSTKGIIKRILKSFGFKIEKLPGPAGKREILRARKN